MADVSRREPKAAPLEVDEADLAAAARCASDEEVGRLWVAVSARAPQDSEGVTWRGVCLQVGSRLSRGACVHDSLELLVRLVMWLPIHADIAPRAAIRELNGALVKRVRSDGGGDSSLL